MNNKCRFLIVFSLIFFFASLQVRAERFKGPIVKNTPKSSAGCLAPTKQTSLELNNVRALLKTNGTMWFQERAQYEVPKGSKKTSMFSASLWIGGLDNAGQLYVAAMTFGQRGSDFWTGPLGMKDASIDQPVCDSYDRFFRISRIEVLQHIKNFQEERDESKIPQSILDWPGNGDISKTQSLFLAPFCKREGSGGDENEYDPRDGDYPYYDFKNDLCPWSDINKSLATQCTWVNDKGECDPNGLNPNPQGLPLPPERILTRQQKEYEYRDNKMIYADHVLKGDETVFWFLNDHGGNHTESKGLAIGLEIRVQAFAFATNDELNKMTFYSYEIINRSDKTIFDCYFSQWVDPDLGYENDDYVGCDVNRGMGYCYNGREIDGTGLDWHYGANPPAVGVDFFQGPYIDPDGTDNPKFDRNKADIFGDDDQKEYCKRFVDYVVNLDPNDPNSYYVVMNKDNTYDTLRYNNQFAINGVNFGDSIVDNERLGMRRFVYHNNDNTSKGDPSVDYEYYRLLKGFWRNGTRMTYGADGFEGTTNVVCDFMFPRGTDYCNWGIRGESLNGAYNDGGKKGNWSEESENNPAGDRRFMQSAGPFRLEKGACNYITVGIPWARASQGGVQASIDLLMVADDKCQSLFENCFKILDGPDAPTLTIREFDQKLVMFLTNSPESNNAYEDYFEKDNTIPEERVDRIRVDTIHIDTGTGDTIPTFYEKTEITKYDQYYRFEGYQIFQVIGPEVGANDLDDPNLARLVKQYDVVNYINDKGEINSKSGVPIGRLINWELDEVMQKSIPKVKVDGANAGIEHTFEITYDAFATGNRTLVNYKTYYFIAIAYAFNEFLHYSDDKLDAPLGLDGQRFPYLRGRKTTDGTSVVPISAVPHPSSGHLGGTTLNSSYGSIPVITRVDGQGNGGIALDLPNETILKIARGGDNGDYRVRELTYEKNAGPLNIKVIDPLKIKPFDFTLYIKDDLMNDDKADVSKNSYWELWIDETVSDEEIRNLGLVDKDKNPIRVFHSTYLVQSHSGRKDSVVYRPIGEYYDEVFIPLGISVGIKNADFAVNQTVVKQYWDSQILKEYGYNEYKAKYIFGQTEKIDMQKDILFSNNGAAWITGLKGETNNVFPSNWIRAGSRNIDVWKTNNSNTHNGGVWKFYREWRLEDAFFPSSLIVDKSGDLIEERAFKDPSGKFASLCGGTWAPYVLTSSYDFCPQARIITPERDVTTYPVGGSSYHFPFYYRFQSLCNLEDQPAYNQTMTNLYSVNVVFTPDQSLWSRCVVLESCPDTTKSEGGVYKNEPRKALSVGKNGKPDNSTDGFYEGGKYGMGWFPGYAVNIETGERLNIMFSENSDVTLNKYSKLVNGSDMIFNPTSTYAVATRKVSFYFMNTLMTFEEGQIIPKQLYDAMYIALDLGTQILRTELGIERVWGGMHYVYVCGSSGNTAPTMYLSSIKNRKRNFNDSDSTVFIPKSNTGPGPEQTWGGYLDAAKKYPVYECGPYDESKWLVMKFKEIFGLEDIYRPNAQAHFLSMRKKAKMQLFNNVMYTHIPMQPEDPKLQNQWMSSDVTYKIRVTRPYLKYTSRWFETLEERDRNYTVPAEYAHQRGFPTYKVSFKELAPTTNDPRVSQSLLDNINIVPNPYYGGSLYEANALDNLVKIINLPTNLKHNSPVTVNIYTVSGILVRSLTKGDNESTYLNWDLKNYANIPIAGGVYIIHVNCPGIGERMLKFFCTMRAADLNTF